MMVVVGFKTLSYFVHYQINSVEKKVKVNKMWKESNHEKVA